MSQGCCTLGDPWATHGCSPAVPRQLPEQPPPGVPAGGRPRVPQRGHVSLLWSSPLPKNCLLWVLAPRRPHPWVLTSRWAMFCSRFAASQRWLASSQMEVTATTGLASYQGR